MLETVAVSADFGGAIPPPRDYTWQSSASGETVRWSDSVPVEGRSFFSVSLAPDKTHRMHTEVNLTALCLGADQTWQSLSEVQARETLARLPGLIESWCDPRWRSSLPTDLSGFRITRLDPSVTLPVECSATAVEATVVALRRFRSGRSVFSLNESDGITATLRFNKERSWSAYEKSIEANAKGQQAPENLLRLEARLRPSRLRSSEYAAWRPSLDWTDMDSQKSNQELSHFASTITGLSGHTVLHLVKSMTDAGIAGASAYRLAAYALASDAGGDRSVVASGVDARTVRRWRSELRNALEVARPLDERQVLEETLKQLHARGESDD